jgi:hypothetical protein
MRRARSKGSVITEFAVGSALVFTLFTGAFQFGYTFYQYNNLHHSVRNAALYGAMRSYDSPTDQLSRSYRDAVRNVAVYGAPSPPAGALPVAPDLTLDHVDVEVRFHKQTPVAVTVSIKDYRIKGLFKTYAFRGTPRVTFRYQGRYTGGL